MPSPVDTLAANLLSPIVLAFALGALATLVRSDLRIPDALYETLSIYLLLAIGLKGGVALSTAEPGAIVVPAVVTVLLGAAVPVWCVAILRGLGRFPRVEAAAIAAHYGSTSAVTFVACITFLAASGVEVEAFMTTLVALMEVPGIVVALLLAQSRRGVAWGETIRELLTGKSIVLLVGGLVIGFVAGPARFAPVEPLFVDLFYGLLVLFLLELGLVAARRFRDIGRAGPFLVGFAVVMPVIHAFIGATLGTAAGLSVGGATVLGILTASASYIAAPAAVRIALPEANPSLYLTPVLAITFPFNLAVGIPLTYAMAGALAGLGG
ncbi:MAG TPA: sodium-dependent bicarbonate transport family permease [Candidatus Limnocylindrales bacterium]|nr:sodium-dependent bicarbonate transport family permease [Candidatus Limnocylindrales bacterium]